MQVRDRHRAATLQLLRGSSARRNRRGESCDSLNKIKMSIIVKNPAIFERFKDSMDGNCFTDLSVSMVLRDFLDRELRLLEVRDDILKLRPQQNRLMAYLKGEVSPTISRKFIPSKESPKSTPGSTSSYSPTSILDGPGQMDISKSGIDLPNLDATEITFDYDSDMSSVHQEERLTI